MSETSSGLSDLDRHSLFEACTREAQRIGGDERTAEYFFVRAQSSRVWLSEQGAVTVADMDIEDWCGAIAWSAPGVGRPPRKAPAARGNDEPTTSGSSSDSAGELPSPTATGAPATAKQPRFGAKARRSNHSPAND